VIRSIQCLIIMTSDCFPHAASFPTSHSAIVLEMSFFSETGDEKHGHVSFDSRQVDTGAQLDASIDTPLDPGESLRIR